MDDAVLLFLLRALSGLILLGFLAALARFVYLDLRHSATAFSQEQSSQGYLHVIASGNEATAVGAIFPLAAVTRIGRAESNTIVLDDAFVSAEHALLARREKQWWLEDLNSRNGTLLNDFPLDEAVVVSSGDVITVGSVQLRVELGGQKSIPVSFVGYTEQDTP
jgi:hypothetical protein